MAKTKTPVKPKPPKGIIVVLPDDIRESIEQLAEGLNTMGMFKKGSPAARLEDLALMIDEQGSMQGDRMMWDTCGVCWGSGVTEESEHNIEQAVLDLREFDLEPNEQQKIDRVLQTLERMLSDAKDNARRSRRRYY